MDSIGYRASRVHTVRVVAPDGTVYDVTPSGFCGLRRALRAAHALVGWLAVDEWESASVFVPEGVRAVRDELRETLGDGFDFARCRVEVATPAPAGPHAPNGYAVAADYKVGERVPELLRQMRVECAEAGWRDEGLAPGPHVRLARVE